MVAGSEHISKGLVNEPRELVPAIPLSAVAQTVRAQQALRSYAIREKATVSEVEIALRGYTNSV